MSETPPAAAQPPQPPPGLAMLQVIGGYWISRAVYVAAKMGLADLLKDGPKSARDLAELTGSDTSSLYRLMRALAGFGFLIEQPDRRFVTTPLGATLESDTPGSLRNIVITELGEEHYPAWEKLLYSIYTGQTAFNQVFGMDPWEFFRRNPENGATFSRAMTDVTGMVTHALLEAYDFSSFRKIVDVGGGHGTFLAAILKATPNAEGIVFDAPEVADGARRTIEQAGLVTRCQAVGGDFFVAVPEGADAYLLKWIIHDWDDDKAIAILKNCRKAIRPGGRLLLFESILAEGNEPDFAKLMDLNMLVMTGGRERTEAQYKSLLDRSGFRLTRAIRIDAPSGVIEAEPV